MMPKHRPRAARSLALSVLVLGVAAAGSGCEADQSSTIGTATSAIANGTASGADQNFTVRVEVSTISIGKGYSSGILLTPTLVLTAAHVVEGINESGLFANIGQCQLNGTPAPAAGFTVTIGADWTTGTSYAVKRIFVDTSNTDCAHDVAILELEKPEVEVTSFPALVLDTKPVQGMNVTTLGFGRTDDQGTVPNVRQTATGTIILAGGGSVEDPGGGGSVPVPDPFFVINTSACPGDSGGPALDDKGNYLGFGEAATTNESSSNSTCEVTYAIDVPFSANVAFIEHAFRAEGLMPHRAGQDPPGDLGASCAINNQCNSNYCVQIGGKGQCSAPCNTNADCPQSFACTDTGGGFSICAAPQSAPTAPSCSTGSTPGSPPHETGMRGLWALSLVAFFGWARYGRRRAARG